MADEQVATEVKVQDEMILKQKEAIEKEIQASHKLVNVMEAVKVLETQFCNDPTFLKNAIQLQVCYCVPFVLKKFNFTLKPLHV